MKPILALLLVISSSLSLQLRGQVPATNSPPAASAPAPASTAAPPPSAPPKRSAAELEKLAMPIALHPDPLISILLPAAVYPVEIVLAARFVRDTNNIPKLDAQPWDENVKAVARYPELIAKMDADLEWTTALGQAFLDQRKELMDTIQALRLKAQQAGTLKTTPQQIVTVTNTVVEKTVEQRVVVVTNTIIQIEPANPQVIYVPSYPPAVYYPAPVYSYGVYYGSPYYPYYPYAPLVTFGVGMMWGAAISHHWNHCDWHGGDVNIDIDSNRNVNRNRNRDRVTPYSDRGGQRWQADQGRLRRSGAPSAETREARGFGDRGGARASQLPASGRGGARPSQQPSLGGSQRPSAGTQPSRSPGASQRPSASQRPASSGASRPSTGQSLDRSRGQSPSAYNRSGGGNSARNFGSRGSASRGGGGFGGARGGGGGRGGGRGGRR